MSKWRTRRSPTPALRSLLADGAGSDSHPSDDERPASCDNCGALLDPEAWTPIATERSDDAIVVYEFCDEECRAEWRD